MRNVYQFVGFLIGRVFRYRYAVVVQNLARALPEIPYCEVMAQINTFYSNLGRLCIEKLIPFISTIRLKREDIDTFQRIHHEGRNIIIIIGHYGNWEMLNRLPQLLNIPTQAVYKPLKNRFFDKVIKGSRSKYGLRLIPSQQALRILIREKETPKVTFFIADQYPGSENGYPVSFLNQQTYAFSGAEKIAKILHAYVVYGALESIDDRTWQLSCTTICEAGQNTSEGVITQRYTTYLERSIRKNPAYWLWSHRRWK
jgi:KDO2-lipid IV(A) lauroyltransferase